MRLDKYLKISRLIKRRTIANEACDADKIFVNGKVARASYAVKIGDIITLNIGQKPLTVTVASITEHATKDNAADLYTIVNS
jgi:ribosomal 50S subunit-recycling heat shock protein